MLRTVLPRLFYASVAATCATALVMLGSAHPLQPEMALALGIAWLALSAWRPRAGLSGVLIFLPVAGLASWTGWITFEEFDLLALATLAGAYGRAALSGAGEQAPAAHRPVFRLAHLLIFAALIVNGIALIRGFEDAGGFQFGWYQGYDGPMNSLRIAKSFVFAVLMLPLFQREWRASAEQATRALMMALTGGLVLAGLAALWERAAFTDVLNFSADYRTTALFWEMHVGGAALDGFLALTVPGVAWWLVRARTPRAAWLPGLLAALAAYTCLTTFSRGVYAGELASLAVLATLLARGTVSGGAKVHSWLRSILLVIGSVVGGYVLFRHGGYRALLAGLMVFGAALPLMPRRVDRSVWVWGLALGAGGVLAVAVGLLAWHLPKGPYVVFTLIFLGLAFLQWRSHRTDSLSVAEGLAQRALWIALAGSAVSLAGFWGGDRAWADASVVMAALLALAMAGKIGAWSLWTPAWRGQAVGLGTAAVLALFVAIFSGGAYMSERFSTSNKDFGSRLSHWRTGLSLLHTDADVWFGKGFGRFPESYYFALDPKEYPGRMEWRSEGGNGFVSMTGPRFFELLNLSQRVRLKPGEHAVLDLDVRSAAVSNIELGVCEKHLLYLGGCAQATVKVPASGEWTHLRQTLDGKAISGGPWYAPRLQFFYVATVINGGRVEVDNLQLTGADGRALLANGDFQQGLARWFFTSDHHHMPWHIKSLFMNVLFDQGVVGLVIFLLMGALALYRLTLGKAAALPMAPYLVAALVGFYVVGMFDSLTDVPRLAFLYHFLILIGLTVRAPRRSRGGATPV